MAALATHGLRRQGFTIVELLIVIVVIAILAVITVVAFNFIQIRANDTAVQSDLRQFATNVLEFKANEGRYPTGPNNTTPVEGIPKFTLTRNAYRTTVHNFYYCTGNVGGVEKFAVGAVSLSGTKYAYYSDGGLKVYTGAWSSSGVNCPGMGIDPYSYGYGHNQTTGWNSWTQ